MQCVGRSHHGQCPYDSTVTIATLSLCDNHWRILSEEYPNPDPCTHVVCTHVEEIVKPNSVVPSVVYYLINLNAQEIKIGYTTQIRKRMKALRKEHNAELYLLATEPGNVKTENTRHKEFSYLNVTPTYRGKCNEWFYVDELLCAYIEDIRGVYGVLDTNKYRSGRVPEEWIYRA